MAYSVRTLINVVDSARISNTGGWKDVNTLLEVYQQSDEGCNKATLLLPKQETT